LAELVGDSEARVSGRGVASSRSGTSERGGASGWGLLSVRGASGTGVVRTNIGDDGDERSGGNLGEKRLSADLEGDGAYIQPPPFCHRSASQPRQKAL
jgi:hypothetical protein